MNLPLEWVETPPPMTAAQAGEYCASLAKSHYENFHVATFFLPKELHQDFYNLYAYCRWSDDLADETGDRARSLHLLELWERQLDECYAGNARHPVFQALAETVRRRDVPAAPFHNLLRAFVQDQQVRRYPTYADVEAYCVNSANPVGRLVLYLCGYRDEERQRLSDFTCTALQLANFWQDVIVDYAKDRIYIPQEDLVRFACTEEQIARREFTPSFRELMRFEVDRARMLFQQGLPLIKMVNPHLAADLDLFSRGGLEILNMIEEQDYNVLRARPSLGKWRKLRLLVSAAITRLTLAALPSGAAAAGSTGVPL
jgi:squalene synthase HpnC